MIKNLLGEQFNNHKFIFYYIGVGIDSSKLTKHNCDIYNVFHNYNLNFKRIELSKIYKNFFNIIIEENCPINLSENSQHAQFSVLFNNFNEIIEQCLNKINGYLIMSQSKYQSIKKIHFNFLTKFKEVRIITPKNKIYKWSVYKLENFEPTSGGKSRKSRKSKKLRKKKSKKLRKKKSKKLRKKKSKKVKKYQKNYNL